MGNDESSPNQLAQRVRSSNSNADSSATPVQPVAERNHFRFALIEAVQVGQARESSF